MAAISYAQCVPQVQKGAASWYGLDVIFSARHKLSGICFAVERRAGRERVLTARVIFDLVTPPLCSNLITNYRMKIVEAYRKRKENSFMCQLTVNKHAEQ